MFSAIKNTTSSLSHTIQDTCVVIPTYNNAATILDVVERAQQQGLPVIVVVDGCTDDTHTRLQPVKDLTLIHYYPNHGKGYALHHGFLTALRLGFSYAITLDADGQHFPEDIPLLLQAHHAHPEAIIIGERQGLSQMERSHASKFANAFSNFWFFVQTGHWLHDTQSGYRLYPLGLLRGLRWLTSRYEAELELLVFASWHGVKLYTTPVRVYYPPRTQRVSHFRPLYDFTRIFILNCILCVLALVYGLPLWVRRKMRGTKSS